MKKTQEKKNEEKEAGKKKTAGAACNDNDCPTHGTLKIRGKMFEGTIIKKFPRRVVIVFERGVYSGKYERYYKSKTKIHARLPDCMEKEINTGDLVRVGECRPLSKLIHFVVIGKIKDRSKEK